MSFGTRCLVEGRSQRAVAKELGIARMTVRKYLEQAAHAVDLLTKYLLKPASEVTLGMLCQLGDGGQGSGSIDKLSGVAQLD